MGMLTKNSSNNFKNSIIEGSHFTVGNHIFQEWITRELGLTSKIGNRKEDQRMQG